MKKLIIAASLIAAGMPAFAGNILGRVTCNGIPMKDVPVTDGHSIVLTDANGRYEIQSEKSLEIVSITTPSGYIAQGTDRLRPGFWQYLNCPVEQDEIHDFILVPQDQSRYRVIFWPDVHLSNDPKRDDINRFKNEMMPAVNKLIGEADYPTYTFVLGDFTHEIYWYQFDFDESDALRLLQDIDYTSPIYAVTGNHDHDGAIIGENVDFLAGWRYRNVWGPDRYSVNIGNEHWIFLDDIEYINVPGKGKKAKGIKGDRSYGHNFLEEHFDWLEKDLALVPEGMKVCLCCHCPVLRTIGSVPCYIPEEQAEKLNLMAERFGGMDIFSGHIHLWDICEVEKYPYLHQYSLPAASGFMWETPIGLPMTGGDGADAGVYYCDYQAGTEKVGDYESYAFGKSYCRVYDMNEVGKQWRSDKDIRAQIATFKESRTDYGAKEWRNYVFVNYWAWEPGDIVELFENGRKVEGVKTKHEDPVRNYAYDLPRFKINGSKARASSSTRNMYEFKTRSAKTPVTVRITRPDGSVRYEQTFQRPIEFNPYLQ